MKNPALSSTRLKIALVAVLIALLREVAAHYGYEIADEVFVSIEVALLALASMDTMRPLGRGKDDPAPAASEE